VGRRAHRRVVVELKKHVAIYIKAFGIGEQSYVPCEACLRDMKMVRATDIHHLENRGMGGSKNKDCLENLCALCRSCHDKAHSDRAFNEYLKETVRRRDEENNKQNLR
jgi:hypothetical protein